VRTTPQGDPTDGGRRRAPGAGQALAIAGSIAAVIGGVFALASTEHDGPEAADLRTASLTAAAPALTPSPATVVSRSDVREAPPYALPAPQPATPVCSPASVARTWPTESAPAHGLNMAAPPQKASPPTTAGSDPGAATSAKPCTASTTVSAPAGGRSTAHPARPTKPHPASKPAAHVPAKQPAVKPKPTVKH
jgi:hypothetical protein